MRGPGAVSLQCGHPPQSQSGDMQPPCHCRQKMGSMCLSCCWWVPLHFLLQLDVHLLLHLQVHLHLLLYLCLFIHLLRHSHNQDPSSQICSLQYEVAYPKTKATQKTALVLPWPAQQTCGMGFSAPLTPPPLPTLPAPMPAAGC